jgi:hypothetical protein
VTAAPDGLDAVASVTPADRKAWIHVVNTRRTRSVEARLEVSGRAAASGTVHQIAAPPEEEIGPSNAGLLAPESKPMPDPSRWTFPAASVSAVELTLDA